MSESKKDKPIHESQSDRWIKYGSNVVLGVVLAIVLAGLLTWFAQRASARVDMTQNGSLSLKPQTLAVLKDLKQHITLVSLYTRALNDSDENGMATRVSDLLDEYRRHSSNIDVRVIDPVTEKDKLESLHQDFISKYGRQISTYKKFLDNWEKQFDQVKKLTGVEASKMAAFASATNAPDSDAASIVSDFVRTIQQTLPQRLQDARDAVDRELKNKHPDYKAAVSTARNQMDLVSQLADQIIKQAPTAKNDAKLPANFRQYLADSLPRYEQIKKLCDDMISQADKLGELKVDQLEQALNVENPVLVLGDNEWRILSFNQIWQDEPDVKAMANGAKVQPRFAGEQQITTAIYTLESPRKTKVCFVRPGGSPLAAAGFPPLVPGGPLSAIVDRLREYKFDVTEKDLSGQWAQQAAMQQQMPSAPEPSDEEIKDAVWVVLDFGNDQGPAMPTIGPKLAQHLKEGGSAVVLCEPRSENLTDVLKDWGVEVHPEAVAVHQTVHLEDVENADPIEEAKARPFIFDCRDYGDHPLAKPEKNLDSVFVANVVVRTHDAAGCKVTPLLPFSSALSGLKTWGETDIDGLFKNTQPPEFNPDKGDLAPPIFGGAAVEKSKAGRLVVIGSISFMSNNIVRMPDPILLRRGILAWRFPGNMEFATNAIFWAAHLDPMIAISPSAMDVSRVGNVGTGWGKFFRVGIFLAILPILVIATGLSVYASRKD